jgi:hypothetical protein
MNALATAVTASLPRFVDNGDGTITDTKLGLMWPKETQSTANVTQYEAEKICAELRLGGYDDWRLPDVEELFQLADRTRRNPAIDTEFFPDTHSDWYWTRTIYADGTSRAAWIVYFGYGGSLDYDRDGGDAFVRAVRSVPAGQ